MTRRHATVRPLILLMRDAIGRFLRIRVNTESPSHRPRRIRRPVVAVQLTLF